MKDRYEYLCFDTPDQCWKYLKDKGGFDLSYYKVVRILSDDELKTWNVTERGFYIYSTMKRKLLKWTYTF